MADTALAKTFWHGWLTTAQFSLLCLLVLVMPTWQAPKSAALGLLCLSLAFERPFLARYAVRPTPIEVALLCLVLTTAIATCHGWGHSHSLRGVKDVAIQCFLFWFVYRHAESEERMRFMCMAALIGILLGLAAGMWGEPSSIRARWALPEVPVINRAAQYVGIGVCLAFSLTLVAIQPRERAFLIILPRLLMVVVLGLALWLLGSRGALIGVFIAILLIMARLARPRLAIWVAALATLIGLIVLALPDSAEKKRALAKAESIFAVELSPSDAQRIEIWTGALRHLRESDNVLFGVGPDNFAAISQGKERFEHAHNWILNKLVEEGALGLAAFAGFFAYLARGLAQKQHAGMPIWLWAAAVGAFCVPMFAGLFAGEWMREHAYFSMIVLGLWAGTLRRISGATVPAVAS